MQELLESLGTEHWCDRGALVACYIARNLSPADLRHELELAIEDYSRLNTPHAKMSLETLLEVYREHTSSALESPVHCSK